MASKVVLDREKYGRAWIQIAGQTHTRYGYQVLRELHNDGFIEATVAHAMFVQNPEVRLSLCKKAANANHPEGLWQYCGFIEHSYILNPNNINDVTWENLCTRAAKLGSVDAMSELGNAFNRRNQFPQSMYWYAMAKANGHPQGAVSVDGLARKWVQMGKPYRYERTEGFTENQYKCALFYLEFASDEEIKIPIDEYIKMNLDGEPLAAYLTGEMFEIAENDEMAFKMYNAIACENDAHGIKRCADMIFAGKGTQRDVQKAINLYASAAEKGDLCAMFNMGELLKSKNKDLAAYWYGVSHSRGYQHSLKRLTQMSEK
jgi:TPR repeat protein